MIALIAVVMCGAALAEAPAATAIDFEDGVFAFVGMDSVKGNADASVLSVVDYNGSKALKVESQGKVPYVAFNLEGLLGENIAKLNAVSFDVGCDLGADGKFYAVSGKVYGYVTGEDGKLAEKTADWSVYMEKKNPKAAKAVLTDAVFQAGAGNYLVISKEVDNYATATGDKPVAFYLDNIAFLDAEGNALPVDTTAVYVSAATEKDMSNLCAVTGAVEFAGFTKSAGAWSQDGLEMPQEIIDALVPGSVVEIEYKSEDGTMWIVMPDSAAGWMRVGDGNNGSASINNAKNVAQIPYELIAQYCGEDKSTWGARMQCEAASAWEVYSVKVGTKTANIAVTGAVEFAGFAKSAGAWAQDGLDMPQEIIDALVPGSVVEIDFQSEDGKMWLVMPDSAAGWMRVGDGNNGAAVVLGNKAYIPYEMIAQYCGEDKSTWGARMQCESSSAWEVYAVKVGTYNELPMIGKKVDFAGFAKSAAAWAQDGLDMPQEIIDALVPGSVVMVNYQSEDGKMWLVMPDSAAGWMRVGDGNNGSAVCTGSMAYIPYEMIAQFCGEDKTTWGARMQCESSSAWEVYSVTVGMAQ